MHGGSTRVGCSEGEQNGPRKSPQVEPFVRGPPKGAIVKIETIYSTQSCRAYLQKPQKQKAAKVLAEPKTAFVPTARRGRVMITI
jgi:hypothetical protein